MWFSKKADTQNEYEVIFEKAPIGIYTLNQKGEVEKLNPKIIELSGINNIKEAIGLNVLTLPSYQESGLDKFIRKGLQGENFEAEVRHLSSLGKKESWRRYRGVPIFNKSQKVERLLLLVEDITETKVVTDDLKEEHTRFQSSLNSINVGFIITDNHGEVVMANFAAKEMFCSPHPSTIKFFPDPKIVNLVCTIDDIAKALKDSLDIKQEVTRTLRGSKSFEFKDIRYKNLFLRIRITPIILIQENQKLEFIGTVILVEDTTDEKILERARADFFSIAAHELKTPLAVIKGNSQILLKQIADQKTDQILQDMFESSDRLIKIVDDFLDLSRFEQGKIRFKKQNLDLIKVTENVINGLKQMAKEKNLYLKLEWDKNKSLKIFADEERVKQVLINIVGNAIKFTEKGGVVITYEQKDGFIKTSVIDTGVGISIDNQQLIFRKFQLAEDQPLTRSTSRSTGVGLYISKLLVESMGGSIKLEKSVPNKGSTFNFTLPAV
ncbi:PAS domain-containing sensor histidine kinase [Candidatus Daviesbacteria bacterium]|nr:PAS domain-containing sensor histidine kinase [Candidatus Daviesbacteria bacterium]